VLDLGRIFIIDQIADGACVKAFAGGLNPQNAC